MRREPAHREVYVRLRKAQVAFPQILSAYDGVTGWVALQGLAARPLARSTSPISSRPARPRKCATSRSRSCRSLDDWCLPGAGFDIHRIRSKAKPAIHSWLLYAQTLERSASRHARPVDSEILARAGPQHGYGIAQRIHQATDDSLRIEEGSLYPALQRMSHAKWLCSAVGDDRHRAEGPLLHHHSRGTTAARGGRTALADLTAAVGKALRFA